MEQLFDNLVNATIGLLGIEKGNLKLLFEENGLMWLWEFFRNYLFSYRVWLFGFLPAVLLQFWRPVFKEHNRITPELVVDALYPLFSAILNVVAVTAAVIAVSEFYSAYLPFANTGLLDDKPLWLQGLGVFLITDIMFYISHRALHEVRWFWYFHAIHHSQTHLNPLTTNRVHPFQTIISAVIRTLPIGIVGGEPTTYVLFTVFNFFWGFFIHANVRINLGFLKYILVTPQFHRVHHSVEEPHFDKNYGERLIIWDWMFRSMYKGFDEYPRTGVPDTEWIMAKSFNPLELLRAVACQMIYPFVMIYRSIVRFFTSRRVAQP